MKKTVTPSLGPDAAGVLRGYTVTERNASTSWTDTYSYEYSLQDGYLETKVSGTSSDAKRRASETLSGYDGWGRRTSLEERTNLKREFDTVLRSARYFAYDAEGGLISRREGELVEERNRPLQFRQARKEDDKFKNFNPVPHLIEQPEWDALSAGEREYWAGAANTHRYSFANGQLLGSVSEAGRMSVGDRLTGFANSSLGTSTVVVRSGETLRSVAQRIYGDGSLWYVLADANGLTNSDETLAEGQNLQVPQVGTNTNSASTFKPYDPSEQIGPTAPSLPTIAPPPKNSCNPIAQLLMVIVSVAVSFVTYGAGSAWAASTFGLTQGGIAASAIGGAIAGAAGATASGVVGSVTGVASFSWRNVASNAVGSAITAGVGAAVGSVGGQAASVGRLLDAGRPIPAAGMALGNAAAGYIGNKVAGVQGTSFSWRNIAGSAVGSMISSAAFNRLGWDDASKFEVGGSFGQNVVTGFVGGLVSAHTQKAFGADVSINEGRMALDAFGNAIGNALGGKTLDARAQQKMQAQLQRSSGVLVQLEDGSFLGKDGKPYGRGVGMTPAQRRNLEANGVVSEMRDRFNSLFRRVDAQASHVEVQASLDGVQGMYAYTGNGVMPLPDAFDGMTADIESQLQINLNPIARTKFVAGLLTGALGSAVEDVEGSIATAWGIEQTKDDLWKLATYGPMVHGYTGELLASNAFAKSQYNEALARTQQRAQILSYVVSNAGALIKGAAIDGAEGLLSDLTNSQQMLRDGDFFDAGIGMGRVAYTIVPLVLGVGAAARAGVSLSRMGIRTLGDVAQRLRTVVSGRTRHVEPPEIPDTNTPVTQVVANKPLFHLDNASAPEIRARLSEAVATLRRDPDVPVGGNIGFAEVDVPAISNSPYVLKAYSGFDDRIGSFIPKPEGSLDTWILKPSIASRRALGPGPYSYLRDVDTEFKILETTAQRLGQNSSAIGRINLFSERVVCPSCNDVIGQFRARYPGIQVNVFWNQ